MWQSILKTRRMTPTVLEQSVRMALETKAIDFILSSERNWKRTPVSNPRL